MVFFAGVSDLAGLRCADLLESSVLDFFTLSDIGTGLVLGGRSLDSLQSTHNHISTSIHVYIHSSTYMATAEVTSSLVFASSTNGKSVVPSGFVGSIFFKDSVISSCVYLLNSIIVTIN